MLMPKTCFVESCLRRRGMAFAALVSLKHTLRNHNNYIQISAPSHLVLSSLCWTLKKLDDNRNKRIDMSKINAVDAEIREAAYKLEDMIQYYVLYRSLPPSHSLADLQIPSVDWDDLNLEIDVFFKRVKKLEEDYIRVLYKTLPEEEKDGEVSSAHDLGGKESTTVGLWDQIEKITNELLDLQSRPKTVSLVGMAGIGKTHVAREVARHPLIVQHFEFIAWVSVGTKREIEDILVDIVAQIEGKPRNQYEGRSILDFLVLRRKPLYGGRYLIVLDDVWSTEVSDPTNNLLPYVGYSGRFLVTTRLQEVAEHDRSRVHQIRFLNQEESWNLLRQSVFAEKHCPTQLEKLGRKIAEKCEGLPLLILTVARILCEHEQQTEEFWKAVAEDEKNPTFTEAYEEISKVLYPSYEYLPQYLKACFLYMAVFPQTSQITLPNLLHLWIAEDFFEPEVYESNHIDYTSLENFAMECLKKLVSHSVVIICKHSSTFTIKSCKLHSAFWYLCTTEARKLKLFHVLKRLIHASKDDIESQRRLSVQNNILFGIKEVYDSMAATMTARSLLCTGPDHEYEVPICLDLVLLKVLDAAAIRFYEFPIKVLKLIRLKYLALTHHGKLPCSIFDLQELQCLILRHHHSIRFVRDVDSVCLPKEMRVEIRDVPEVKSIKLLGDSTSLAKEIWEKICDIQQVWSRDVYIFPLEKKTWMELWRIASGEGSMKKWSMMSHMQRPWSIKLLRDSTRFPKNILGQIWEKTWDIQEAWSTKLQRDSLGLVKEIWEEMWEIQEVRSTEMLGDSTFLPKEIWEMRQLRYLRIIGRNLPDPSYETSLRNLSTLHVNAHSCTYSVFNGLRPLKKLGIKLELPPDADAAETISCFSHIRVLECLQSLKCVVENPQRVVAPGDQLSNLPRSLKKLSLSGLGYGWEWISAIGSLPELQVLKLRCAAFQGPIWETKVDEFRSLKYLLLEDIDLVRWTTAENGCFPSLERLIIGHCYKLKELPLLGGLKMIEVVECSPSVVGYAEQARSSSVEVLITSSWKLPR